MANAVLQRSFARWYPLNPHPVQDQLKTAIADGVRFPVVPAGRRSGKTEIVKRAIALESMRKKSRPESYFLAAPTRDQAKRIFWDDMKLFTFSVAHERKPSETELKIYMPNGDEVVILGLDKPARIEGSQWGGGCVDEIADVKEGAWEENILPALNTVTPERPDYRAWCYLLGVPDGLGNYYDMAEYARTSGDPLWQLYHWKSAEILPADVIDSMRKSMSARQFRQECEGSFETASGRIYEDYSDDNLVNDTVFPHEQIWWCHDQNFTPMSSAICVNRKNSIYILDEIILRSAVARQTALEFVDLYKDHQNKHVVVYGDPAGRAGEKHGHASDYIEIEKVLQQNGWKFTRKVKSKHPAIRDRQNSVRAKIKNAAGDVSLFVNPNKAKYAHKGLATVQVKKGSTFQEEETEYQHITTAIGYMTDYEYPANHGSTAKLKIGGV